MENKTPLCDHTLMVNHHLFGIKQILSPMNEQPIAKYNWRYTWQSVLVSKIAWPITMEGKRKEEYE